MSISNEAIFLEHAQKFSHEMWRLGLKSCRLKIIEDSEQVFWTKIATWNDEKPFISMWYGKWFHDHGKERFWFGFQGDKSRILALRRAIEEQDLLPTSMDFIESSPKWDTSVALDDDGVVYEISNNRYFLGIYDVKFNEDPFSVEIIRDGSNFINKIIHNLGSSIDRDIDEINTQPGLTPSRRKSLILARRGQGAFRRKVEGNWGAKCALTGCAIPEVLRASHIKPWAKAQESEKLDGNNGLLLCATLDALFDKGLISFDSGDRILIDDAVLPNERSRLKLEDMQLLRPLSRAEQKYMTFHRRHFRYE